MTSFKFSWVNVKAQAQDRFPLAAIKLEACWRGALARKAAKKRTWAVQTIRK